MSSGSIMIVFFDLVFCINFFFAAGNHFVFFFILLFSGIIFVLRFKRHIEIDLLSLLLLLLAKCQAKWFMCFTAQVVYLFGHKFCFLLLLPKKQ